MKKRRRRRDAGQHTNKYRSGAWKFAKVFVFTLTTVLCGGMMILLAVSLMGIRGNASAVSTASGSDKHESDRVTGLG